MISVKKKVTFDIIISLMLTTLILAIIPVQYQATGTFIRCLDNRTYMILGINDSSADTTYPKNTNTLLHDDILKNYDTIDVWNYPTNDFATGDILRLTRNSNMLKQLMHRIWLCAHFRIYNIEVTIDFANQEPSKKFGTYFDVPIEPAIEITKGHSTKIGQLPEKEITALDNRASSVSKGTYFSTYHYDDTGIMPEIISPNNILWQ